MVTIGKVRDAHGLKGELFVILFAGQADWADGLKEITLTRKEREKNDKGVEETIERSYIYPIKRFKIHKRGMILKVDGLSDRTESEAFAGALGQIQPASLSSQPGERVYLKELENFEVQDAKLGVLGKISGFSSNGAQDLIVVMLKDDTRAEIPLIPEFISSLDFKTKRIEMNLPEGLVGSLQ
ncbi:MAG: ribosome maturation factor RimM [Bdellovibrionia bacterium]